MKPGSQSRTDPSRVTRVAYAFLLAVVLASVVPTVSAEPTAPTFPIAVHTGSGKFLQLSPWGTAYPGHATGYAHMADLTDAGMNTVTMWVGPSTATSKVVAFLNAAQAHGLAVRLDVARFLGYYNYQTVDGVKYALDCSGQICTEANGRVPCVYDGWPAKQAQLQTLVDAVKTHPALFYWETLDEPERYLLAKYAFPKSWLTGLKTTIQNREGATYKHLVRLNYTDILQIDNNTDFDCIDHTDTTYPVSLYPQPSCTKSHDRSWRDAGDIYTMDIYPVGHPWYEAGYQLNGPRLGFEAMRDEIIIDDTKPQGFILQGASLTEMDGGTGGTRPTLSQTRFMAYDVLAAGAKVIDWFGVNHVEPASTLWSDVKKVANEMNVLQDAYAAGTTLSASATLNCHVLAKFYNNKRYVVVTNPSTTSISSATITVSGLSGTVREIFSNRVRTVSGGAFTDSFTPWGVRVYGPDDASIGAFETPVNNATVSGSVPVSGWALDTSGIKSLDLYQRPGTSGTFAYMGSAIFVEGTRPDVAAAYPLYPQATRAGWGYMLLTHGLGADGVYQIQARATDNTGVVTTLGTVTINVANATSSIPFGALDTPASGGIASGASYRVQGWVLTRTPDHVDAVDLYIDNVFRATVTYGLYNAGLTSFPTSLYPDAPYGSGYVDIDTRAYANGWHTIAWVARDSAGHQGGIGSRYFRIQNDPTQ